MKERTTWFAPVGLVTLLTCGCGSPCPDVDGDWRISAHCQSDMVGDSVDMRQDECDLNMAFSGGAWTGSLEEDGDIRLSGYGGTELLTCRGDVNDDEDRISVSCTPGGCGVTLKRD